MCRVIVNQAHCFATGGSFDNALPFSLSMGCGTWGGNSISDNLNYRHFLNITRVVAAVRPERVREPTEDELFGALSRAGMARESAAREPVTSSRDARSQRFVPSSTGMRPRSPTRRS